MIPRSLESQNLRQHIKTHKVVKKWSTSVEKKGRRKGKTEGATDSNTRQRLERHRDIQREYGRSDPPRAILSSIC